MSTSSLTEHISSVGTLVSNCSNFPTAALYPHTFIPHMTYDSNVQLVYICDTSHKIIPSDKCGHRKSILQHSSSVAIGLNCADAQADLELHAVLIFPNSLFSLYPLHFWPSDHFLLRSLFLKLSFRLLDLWTLYVSGEEIGTKTSSLVRYIVQ